MSDENAANNNQDIENVNEEEEETATDTESEEGGNNGNQMRERIEHLEVEIQSSRQRIHNLEQLLQRREARIQSLSREKRLAVQNFKAQLRASERELKAANKKVLYRDEKIRKTAADFSASRSKKELEMANKKLLDQNEVIADISAELKELKKKDRENNKKFKQEIKSKEKEISALNIQLKGATKIEKENDNLKKRLSKVEEMKLETQRDIAAKRLKNTELILEQRKLDREIKEQEKQHKEHLMIKKTELRTKEKAMDQLMKDQAKAKQLEEHHKRIHSFSQKFCGTGRPDYRTGRFPHLSAPFAGMNADNPFLAEAIAEAARKTAASAKVDAEKKTNKYMETFNSIM